MRQRQKRVRTMGALVAVLGGSVAVSAQSLADVARREAERRKKVTEPAKVYTNEDVERSTVPLTTGTAVKPQETTGATPGAAPGDNTAGTDKTTAEAAGDEASWRARIAEARQNLARAEAFERALQSQINGLWADFTARDNPVERANIEKDRNGAIGEQSRVRKEIESLKKQIGDIEEEARRAGVPPGWLR